MADTSDYIQQTQSAVDYAQAHNCFHDHRDALFCFPYQIERLQETSSRGRDSLIHQPNLTSASLPSTCIDIDFGDEPVPNLETLDSPYAEMIGLVPSIPLDDGSRTLGQLRFPSEPLDLECDFSKDFHRYLNNISCKFSCNVFREWLPLTPVNVDKDEGLSFSSTSSRWQRLASRELDREKAEVSDRAEKMLKDLNDLHSASNYSKLTEEDLGLRQLARFHINPVSSPISPPFDVDSPFLPNQRATIIDLTSEPSSPETSSVHKLRQAMQNGTLDSDVVAPSIATNSLLEDAIEDIISLQCNSSNLKVDVPLMISSPDKIEDWNSLGEKLDVAEESPLERESHPITPTAFFDDAMEEILKSCHERTAQNVESERLKATESLLRVEVPNLNFDISDPEWHSHLSSSEIQFRWMKAALGPAFSLNPTNTSLQLGASLKWTPIPQASGRALPKEVLDSPGPDSRQYLILEAPYLCSDSYIPHPQGPSILNISCDKEDFESDTSTSDEDMNSTRVEGVLEADDSIVLRKQNLLDGILRSRVATHSHAAKRKTTCGPNSILPFSTDSSATTKLLSTFLHLRFPKKLKMSNSNPQKEEPRNQASLAPLVQAHLSPRQHINPHLDLSSAPIPTFNIPLTGYRLIVSTSLDRKVLSQIEQAWPQLELIDKDFSQYNEIAWPSGSTLRKEIISPLSFEADISVSPGVGVLLTSLLKAKQKPLPGSAVATPLHQRVERVSEKYESLFILVSVANPLGEYVCDICESDKGAYTNFVQFTASLQRDITVELVQGAEKTLSKWALEIMSRFAAPSSGFQKLVTSKDTEWGLFLRRAGMNIFASQVLETLLATEYGESGIYRFLAMSVQEKVLKYGRVLGGNRVLGFVSKTLGNESG